MPFLIGWTAAGIVLGLMALSRGDNAAMQFEGYKIALGFVVFGMYKIYKRWRSQ